MFVGFFFFKLKEENIGKENKNLTYIQLHRHSFYSSKLIQYRYAETENTKGLLNGNKIQANAIVLILSQT